MFWFICTVIQLILWWVTFFKSKKMTREITETRLNGKIWSEFALSNERYKFPLGIVVVFFLICLIPILGTLGIIAITYAFSQARNSDFDDERPSFAIVELLKKKI